MLVVSSAVCIHIVKSNIINGTSDVTKVSHLNLFINDLDNILKYANCVIYAEDIEIVLPVNSTNDA